MDGAVNLAILDLTEGDQSLRILAKGEMRSYIVGSQSVTVSIKDEAGKVDANRGSTALLKAMLDAIASDSGGGKAWSARVPNRENEVNGVADAGASRTSRVPFRTLEEAMDAFRVPYDMAQCVESDLTVYTGMENVDRRYADALVLKALQYLAPEPASSLAESPQDVFTADSYTGHVLGITAAARSGEASTEQVFVLRITGAIERPALLARRTKRMGRSGLNTQCIH